GSLIMRRSYGNARKATKGRESIFATNTVVAGTNVNSSRKSTPDPLTRTPPEGATLPVAASFDTKERVRQAIDIVELVRDYLGDVQREGRGFKALCPWHEDSRPSLKINP